MPRVAEAPRACGLRADLSRNWSPRGHGCDELGLLHRTGHPPDPLGSPVLPTAKGLCHQHHVPRPEIGGVSGFGPDDRLTTKLEESKEEDGVRPVLTQPVSARLTCSQVWFQEPNGHPLKRLNHGAPGMGSK